MNLIQRIWLCSLVTLSSFILSFSTASALGPVVTRITQFRANPAPETYLFLDSQTGDFIGQGKTVKYDLSTGTLSANFNYNNDPLTGVRIAYQDSAHSWSASFSVPSGLITPGVYENASRFPFNGQSYPGLSITGDSRGCNILSGRFIVHEATYTNGRIATFSADFQQFCEDGATVLNGAVRYNAQLPHAALNLADDIKAKQREINRLNYELCRATSPAGTTCFIRVEGVI